MADQNKIPPDTLNFLFDYLRDAPERQVTNLRDLDAKIVWIFGAATVVIGLTGASVEGSDLNDAESIALGLGLLSYLCVAVLAFFGVWPITFWRSLNVDVLWHQHWQDPPQEIKHALVADIVASYSYNRSRLSRKAYVIQATLAATAVETLFVALALALVRVG
jgi:hypothetical protein